MKDFIVVGGTFSKKGNMTAKNSKGEQIFVHRNLLSSIGVTAENIKFPMYAIAGTKTITPWDESGNPVLNADGTAKTEQREEALSLFLNREAIEQAYVDEATLSAGIRKAVATAASTIGLSQAAVDQLVEAAF